MMRFYRPTVEALLVQTIYCKEQAGFTLADLTHALRNWTTGNQSRNNILAAARKASSSVSLAELTENLFTQLAEDGSMRKESDLIDELVRTLQLPFARNVLSGDTLKRLRNAILLPSEQGGLLHRLRAREMACAGCGTDFHDSESITFSNQEGAIALFCHRCVRPASVSCAGCETTANLSEKAITAMSKMLCPACLAKKTAGQTLTPPKGTSTSSPLPTFSTGRAGRIFSDTPFAAGVAERVPVPPTRAWGDSIQPDAIPTPGQPILVNEDGNEG
jgi:hypothetical protein